MGIDAEGGCPSEGCHVQNHRNLPGIGPTGLMFCQESCKAHFTKHVEAVVGGGTVCSEGDIDTAILHVGNRTGAAGKLEI